MMLGLIMVTLDQLSDPEESFHDSRPVLTLLTFRCNPSITYAAARARASPVRRSNVISTENSSFPSLIELMLCYLRSSSHGLTRDHIEDFLERSTPHLLPSFHSNTPFYHHYNDPPINPSPRSRRKEAPSAPRVMYLTSATLIIVPSNLLSQWDLETHKHCYERYTQRFLVLRPGTKLPPARTLANDFDVRIPILYSIHAIRTNILT